MTDRAGRAHASYLGHKLRRLGVLAVSAGILVFGAYSVANRLLDGRLDAAVRAVDESEGAWRLEDLQRQRAPVPDAENAARVVQALAERLPERFAQQFFLPRRSDTANAHALASVNAGVKAFQTLASREPLTQEQAWPLRAAIQQVEPIAREARRLADYRHGHYAIDHGLATSTPSPEGLGIRQIVFLLRHDALLSLHEGRVSDSLRACRAILVAGRALGDEPAPIYQMLRVECWDEALPMLERTLAQSQPPAEDLDAVQQLLEAEAAEPLSLLLLRGELAWCHLRFSALEAGQLQLFTSTTSPPVASALDWLARDAIKLPHAGVIAFLARRVAIARQPLALQGAALQQLEQERHVDSMFGASVGDWRSGRLLKFVQNGQLRLRAAATAVAVERYRARHDRWPDGLAALVPDFLSQVPEDPMTATPLLFQRIADGVVISYPAQNRDKNRGRVNATPAVPGREVGFRLWNSELR